MRRCAGALALTVMVVAGCATGDGTEVGPIDPVAAPASTGSTAPVATWEVGTVVARARDSLVVARTDPDDDATTVGEFSNPVASGGALVFRVLTPPDDVSGEWLEVMLPVRPNGTVGWIRTDAVDLSLNPFRIELDTSDHRLDLYENGSLTLSTDIAVGTGDTPTPYGEFYLAELLEPPDPGGVYGPFAFGLSGFSEVLDSFAGGDGVVGIHGTDDPSALGRDVSHGCVRVLNDVIEDLAARVPLGTPVSIRV